MIPGHEFIDGCCHFCVWAPEKQGMVLHIVHPHEEDIAMQKRGGYFHAFIKQLAPGARYFYRPDDGKDYPDPVSHYQPLDVHGPSQTVNHADYIWKDVEWKGIPFRELALYEIHVGTFTKEGTFEAIIPLLGDLAALGINAIELMPVAQFPGNRNWGYDGVYPYAVQQSYGGPEGLKKLVDACHAEGIAVFLDVVYNHLGPEGNYLSFFGPYFTDQYRTPWGPAINFDGEWSDGVREYFSNNPLHWFGHYHIDGIRADAIHTMYDAGAVNFWELTHSKLEYQRQKSGRPLYLTSECDLNSPRVVRPPGQGGYGFDAVWLDDFHHALYVLLDEKGKDRYIDFGRMDQLVKAYKEGFVHSGDYVKFRKRKHGASSAGIPGDRFVIFNHNHDQVGNRVGGERLSMLISFELQKLAAAALLLAPYVPLLFMGEEYAEDNPFFYFVSHGDRELIKAVQEGRKKEFENYKWDRDPPDPQSEETFNRSKLQWNKRNSGKHAIMLNWYRQLLLLRRTEPALMNPDKNDLQAFPLNERGFVLHRKSDDEIQHIVCIFNFANEQVNYELPSHCLAWTKLLDAREIQWTNPSQTLRAGTDLPLHAIAGQRLDIAGSNIAVYAGVAENERERSQSATP